MSEKDMSSITSPSSLVSSSQTEYFILRWKACWGARSHAVILYYDSSLNETTVLALHKFHRSFIGVQPEEHTHTHTQPSIKTLPVRWQWQSYWLCMTIQIMHWDDEGKWCQTDRPSDEAPSLDLPLSELTACGLRFKQRQDVKLCCVLTPAAVLSRKREAKQQWRLL